MSKSESERLIDAVVSVIFPNINSKFVATEGPSKTIKVEPVGLSVEIRTKHGSTEPLSHGRHETSCFSIDTKQQLRDVEGTKSPNKKTLGA